MGFLDFLKPKKPKSALDVLRENPLFQQLETMRDTMCADGCDTDELPNGVGEFGLVPSNPIPTCLAIGSNSYLRKLCTPDGEPVSFERTGTTSNIVSPHPIDVYAITSSDGRDLGTLYISMYHKSNSTRIPKGFMSIFGDLPT